MTTKIEPHSTFKYYRPDEVAETVDGVFSIEGLYEALWALTTEFERSPGHKTNEELEEPTPGYENLASVWDKLSPEHQQALNDLMVAHEKELGIGDGE